MWNLTIFTKRIKCMSAWTRSSQYKRSGQPATVSMVTVFKIHNQSERMYCEATVEGRISRHLFEQYASEEQVEFRNRKEIYGNQSRVLLLTVDILQSSCEGQSTCSACLWQKCTLHHETTFFCFSSVKIERKWLRSEELKFWAKMCSCCISKDRTTTRSLRVEILIEQPYEVYMRKYW